MNYIAIKRSQEISAFSNDEPITAYFRQLIAEKTGIVVSPDTPKPVIRSMICGFEELMKQAAASGEMVDANPNYVINHHFTDGVYAREMHIPAGHVVVGKIHRHEHLNFVSKGRATVITEDGGMQQVKAGDTLISPAGVKRLLITHEDTVWTVVHATGERDLEKIEEAVIAKTYADMGWEMPVPLLQNNLDAIRQDYGKVLSEVGITQQQVEDLMEASPYSDTMPDGYSHLHTFNSPIHDLGVVSDVAISKGDTIGPARLGVERTLLGRYVNHSPNPNAEFRVCENGDLETIALTDIPAGVEILYDYRQGARIWKDSFEKESL